MLGRLRLFIALLIAVGFGALVVVTALLPIDPRIGIELPDPVHLPPIAVGLAFWVLLALIGSALTPERPQGIIVTLDLPFIVAATVLGGPVAGAWVAMIGSLELSEVPGTARIDLGPGLARRRHVPWYGALMNHAAGTFAAAVGGIALMAVQPSLSGASALDTASRDLIGVLLVAAIFVALTDVTSIEALALRSTRSFVEVAREFGFGYRATLAAEAIVAWLMVEIFVPVGWWGAALCVAAIAAIYRGLDVGNAVHQGKVDALTGLWNRAEFLHRAERLLGGRGSGRRRIVVMEIEVRDLELTNRRYGHGVGDEVLRAVAQRMRRSLRPADDPARLEAGVFGALLVLRPEGNGTRPDADLAEAIAMRIHREVTAAFSTGGQPVEIRASIGVAVAVQEGGPVAVETLLVNAGAACRIAERTDRAVIVRVLPT